jgi:DNA-binding NtrC family response regulator
LRGYAIDALAIQDGESRLLLLNPVFERVMGLKHSEILGRKVRDLVREGVTDTAASLKVIGTGIAQTVIINTRAGRQILRPEHLPKKYLASPEENDGLPSVVQSLSLKEEVEKYELKLIRKVLSRSTTLEETAQHLGISLSTLTRRMRIIKNDGHN